ncbi:MAG: divergent polysaccharide deacetylase family protein [Proteobacteria bacterium]|nr:divergent polysaccharide deacetylase family protein [Pseudomonadota bacterium]MBU1712023.1 divergent polysaccharide deacetylase family protein [Pseudomonadota bacterium]
MAKSNKPKRNSSGSKKGGSLKVNIKKAVSGVFILLVLVIGAGFLANFLLFQKESPPARQVQKPEKKGPPSKQIIFEVYPKSEESFSKTIVKTRKPPDKSLPNVAIIIDDLGYDNDLAKDYLKLGIPFTFSLLPFSPYQKSIAMAAHKKGIEIMLHLPMEPDEYPQISPGPGALLTSMIPDKLIEQLNNDIDDIPFIKGVNNHMGSKMTAIDTQMYQIFSVLKKRNLYFVDSRTTAMTICGPSARLFKVPFAERDVFIDHSQAPDFIRNQIKSLVKIADKHGEAVGIIHPHPETYLVIREMLPYLQKRVNLVPASTIVSEIN